MDDNEMRANRLPKGRRQERRFRSLLQYIDRLAQHKLGYPVSLLTYFGIIDNKLLGIDKNSLANVLLNNVGDPFVDSETSLMEVKIFERKLIRILERYYGLKRNSTRGYVTTGGTEGNFAALWWSKRFLISSALDALIATDGEVKALIREEQQLQAASVKIPNNDYPKRVAHLQKIIAIHAAIAEKKNKIQEIVTPTVFFTKDHTHYSVGKGAEILRLNSQPIMGNPDGTMHLPSLQKELILHVSAHPNSAIIVIANIGTTVTGAVDNPREISAIINTLKPKPLHTIHMDGALTGFVLPIIKPFGEVENYLDGIGANTLVFSAHKYPGLSQPCGILLARREFFDKAFEKSERAIEYVGNIRDVTITGSRSGLNVLMFYNAIFTLGLNKNSEKIKSLFEENIAMARYLYNELIKIYGEDKVRYPHHFNVMFPKPSMQLAQKYQLMVTGNTATVCILPNVNKKLIDEFLHDLIQEKEDAMKAQKLQHTIKPLTQEYVQATAELFTKCFCDSEPITKHINISHADYMPFALEVIEKAVKDGLSRIMVTGDNKVIACIIAEDMSDRFDPDLSKYTKLKPIINLLDDLSKPFVAGKRFTPGKVIHMWIAAVDPAYRTQHLYLQLGMACIQEAMQKGYEFAYSDFTHDLSKRIVYQFELLRLINKVKYSDFVCDGRKPFDGLKGEAVAYLTPLRPEVKLDSLGNCYTIEEHF